MTNFKLFFKNLAPYLIINYLKLCVLGVLKNKLIENTGVKVS